MLIDKLTKRKIVLLDLLYDSNGMTLQEIQLKLNLSIKTIKNELNYLFVDCPYSQDEISIKKIDNKYYLVQGEKVNIEVVKRSIKKNSLLFKVYYKILNEKFYIANESSNEFFCSKSNLYSQLSLVKKYVENNNIYIDKKQKFYCLKGSEIFIRFQAHQIFSDYSSELKYLINQELQNKIKRLLFEIEKDLGLTFLNIDIDWLTSWLWISKMRVDLGIFVKREAYYDEQDLNSNDSKKTKEKILVFLNDESECDLNQEADFLLLILKITLKKNCYNKSIESKNGATIFHFGTKFMNEFRDKFDTKKDDLSISSLVGEAFFYHQNLDLELLDIQQEKFPEIALFDQKFNLFFSDFVLENKIKRNNLEKLYDYVHNLCYEQVNPKSYRPVINIMVSMSSGGFSEYKIKQVLSKLNYNLNLEERKVELTDLVVTNYSNIEFKEKVFYCSNALSPNLLVKLEIKLAKLEKNKPILIS
ncbi:hypothetical protein CMALT430_10173 [Carnobacterium maltaromaticum]|uniref:response regulator transcription factor n=1 Tax=Carnobacterium maltaromaticum TaxID=2751 RepID=UPI00191BA7DD|nr:response regulator transcription factor [Carnobacterium maltaromaticum]CAD5896367.1 hypothetical protein CMALT430_10173 [Carnobacterium maltaromaticum]